MGNYKMKPTYETPYTLQYARNNIRVLKDGVIQAQGFRDEDGALTTIHKLEGKNPNDFYVVSDGVVEKVERDAL